MFYLLNRAASLILIVALISLASHAVSAYAFIAIYAAGMSAAVLYGVGQISPGVSDFRELRTFLPQIPLVRQGISCGMQNAAFILLSLSPFLLLGAFSTPSEIGLYGISQRLVAVVILALTTISQVALGDFSRAFGNRDFAALARDLTASLRLTFAAAIGLTLPLIAFSPFLVLIFGKAFAAAAPTLVLLSLVTCAQCLGMPFQAALFATKHEKLARNVTFACATAGIALNAILIPGWGAEGAALGTGAGLALQSIGHAACALRVLPVRFSLALFQIVLRSAPVGVP